MKKILAMILAVVLLMTACVAGTLAWLTDTTQEVQNTFTVGNIDITLTESDSADDDTDAYNNSYKMIPGATITKDPKVTVLAGSEKCWLFVEITKTEGFDKYLTYSLDEGWVEVEGDTNRVVYGYNTIIDASTDAVQKSVLANDRITVNTSVTKADMDALEKEDANLPTLTFKAYAIQSDNLKDDSAAVTTATAAWKMVKPATP